MQHPTFQLTSFASPDGSWELPVSRQMPSMAGTLISINLSLNTGKQTTAQ